jgi:hypothetical protein
MLINLFSAEYQTTSERILVKSSLLSSLLLDRQWGESLVSNAIIR